MIYEEKILDYLDGALGDKESAELMHQLSVSPERRVILEQHLQLKHIIGDARKPFAVPSTIEAKLAERLPVIANYNREIAGTAMIGSAVRSPFFGRVAAGIVIALLLGATGYFALLRNGGSDSPEPALNSAATNGPQNVTPPSSIEAAPTQTLSATPSATASEVSAPNAYGSAIPSRTAHRNIDRTPTALADKGEKPFGGPVPDKSMLDKSNVEEDVSLAKPGVLNAISTADEYRSEPLRSELSIGERNSKLAMRMPMEASSDLPLALRIDYSIGQSYNQVRETDASITNRNALAPGIGIDYVLSPQIAVGIEGGKTDISRVEEIATVESDEDLGIKCVVLSHDIVTRSEFNTRAMLRYTFNPYDPVRLEASIGGGAAFGDHVSPLVSWSVMSNYRLTEKIGIIAGVAFTGTFARSGGSASVIESNEPVAYIAPDQAASSTLFTPSFLFKVGLRVTPW